MEIDIELAHKLSLVQRNLQTAQTAVDSAEEFLQQIINYVGSARIEPAQHEDEETARVTNRVTNRLLPAPAQAHNGQPGRPGRPKKAKVDADILREFMAGQTGRFDTDDVRAWLKDAKGIRASRQDVSKKASYLLKTGEVTSNGRGKYEAAKQTAKPAAKAAAVKRSGSGKQIRYKTPYDQHILQFAREHDGQWIATDYYPTYTKDYHEDYRKKNGSIFGAVHKLVKNGDMRKTGPGRYELTAKGRQTAAETVASAATAEAATA